MAPLPDKIYLSGSNGNTAPHVNNSTISSISIADKNWKDNGSAFSSPWRPAVDLQVDTADFSGVLGVSIRSAWIYAEFSEEVVIKKVVVQGNLGRGSQDGHTWNG